MHELSYVTAHQPTDGQVAAYHSIGRHRGIVDEFAVRPAEAYLAATH